MKMYKIKTLLITIVVLCVASICQAKEKSILEAKLAKLEAAAKAKQSIPAKKLIRKEKTLAEKIAELEARQKGLNKDGKTRDTRITSLQSRLAVLDAKLRSQQNDRALAKRVTQIEQKVLALKNQLKQAKADSSLNSEKTDVIGKLELSTQTFAAAPKRNISPIKPIEVNFLDTTALPSQESDGSDFQIAETFAKAAEGGVKVVVETAESGVKAVVETAEGGVKAVVETAEGGVKAVADVVEGGVQITGMVLDQLQKMVRRRGKPSPSQQKRPQFLTDELRTPDDSSKSRLEWQSAFGDFGGLRPWLDEQGFIFEGTYTGEFFKNMRGGLNTHGAGEYRGNLDMTLTVDTEKLGLAPGAVFVYAQTGHGTSLTEYHVGDTQTLSNIDAPYLMQISEYWIEQEYYDGHLRLKLGKQDSNADFVAVTYGENFLQSSFAVIPTVPMPTFPDPALGAAAFWEPADWLTIGAGIYEGAPDGRNSGFRSAFDKKRHDGVFSIYELALKSEFGAQKDLPGTYRFGGWYHSDDFDEVGDEADPDVFEGNNGFYIAFDQMLHHEKDDSDQGLGAFFQFGWSPENRNETNRYFGAGLSYVGLIPGRDEDITGIGLAQLLGSNRVDDLHRETAIELFYKAQLTEWASIQPDLQYIADTGGSGKDAVVFGIRFEIVF